MQHSISRQCPLRGSLGKQARRRPPGRRLLDGMGFSYGRTCQSDVIESLKLTGLRAPRSGMEVEAGT